MLSHHCDNQLLVFQAVNAKILPIFCVNRNLACKCTKLFRTDTVLVLFLTIGKPDIYQHKSLDKSATDFYPGD
jgi:hypothetical protein